MDSNEINSAIKVIKEQIERIMLTDPSATVEIENLEFAIVSLEGRRDEERMMAKFSEEEKLLLNSA